MDVTILLMFALLGPILALAAGAFLQAAKHTEHAK
jgi:hypothetical protein